MFGILKNLGKLVGKVAPVASMFIPGIGPAAGAAIAGGGALIGGDDPIKSAAMGALGGLGNKALFNGEGLSALTGNPMGTGEGAGGFFSGLEKNIGKAVTSPSMLGNKEGTGLDLGKTMLAGTAISNLYGQSKDREATNKYNKNNARLTNDILGRLLSPGPGLSPSVMDYGKFPQ